MFPGLSRIEYTLKILKNIFRTGCNKKNLKNTKSPILNYAILNIYLFLAGLTKIV